eukprot:11472037-Alexandrium_andersonii.AAC.1
MRTQAHRCVGGKTHARSHAHAHAHAHAHVHMYWSSHLSEVPSLEEAHKAPSSFVEGADGR